jgi:hypothetical protein
MLFFLDTFTGKAKDQASKDHVMSLIYCPDELFKKAMPPMRVFSAEIDSLRD